MSNPGASLFKQVSLDMTGGFYVGHESGNYDDPFDPGFSEK